MNWLDELSQHLKTEEGKKEAIDFFSKLKNEQRIENTQYERFNYHLKNSTKDINFYIQKVINHYNTTNYKNRHLSRGIEPPEYLKFFLYEYASKYGTINENGTYQLGDYSFELIIGQGSYVAIKK